MCPLSIISFDQRLLLAINGSQSSLLDGMMWVATSTVTWIPLFVVLIYMVARNNTMRESAYIFLCAALVVLLADRFASGLCKPLFHRWRPAQDPYLMYLVDVVNAYRGGRYGFISSHAANTFGIAVFMSLFVRHTSFTITMCSWALINVYTRMYLGVHYPGDILFGTIWGCFVGWACHWLYGRLVRYKYSHLYATHDSRYSRGNYLLFDVHLVQVVYLLSLLLILPAGMYVCHVLNL